MDYLELLWEHTVKPVGFINEHWNKEQEALYNLGIGMEETLNFLYNKKPGLLEFKAWIKNKSVHEPLTPGTQQEDTLSTDDLAFWKEHGFVVIRNAITPADCEAAQNAIWNFLTSDPNDKNSWYKANENQKGLMLTFTDNACLQKNRQSPKIKKAFEQLYNSTNLYKTIDKVSFNPPETDQFSFMGSGLHWDVSLKQPIALELQGLLYLTDCDATGGAFHCVPGFHTKISDWMNQLAPDENARAKAPQTLTSIPVPGKAGDFVIWHAALPHCATPNKGEYPRMVQYLKYLPVDFKEETEWI